MYSLEQSIADWRRQTLAAGIKTPVPLEELEIHLREEIERQMKSGISAQEAFTGAVQQIGKADMMKNEFEKVDGAKELRAWKQIQIISFAGLGVISLFIAACVIFKLGSFSEVSPVPANVRADCRCRNDFARWRRVSGLRIFPGHSQQADAGCHLQFQRCVAGDLVGNFFQCHPDTF